MSRVLFDWCPELDSFPRVSGDEPAVGARVL